VADEPIETKFADANAVSMSDLFKGKKVAVFGVPAPFTGVCQAAHYPPYKKLVADFKSKGIDEIVCYSVTDPYTHYNWAEKLGNDSDEITFLADVDASWAKENKLDIDASVFGLGIRANRFSMIVDDGKVTSFQIVANETAHEDAAKLLEQA